MKKLVIDWCNHASAKYACLNWHYSKCMPVGKLIKVGVWENDIYIGCVIFGRGANKDLLKPYGLEQIDGCELVRIALNNHLTTVSRIMMIAIKFLKKKCPDIKLIISFSDISQGHHGGIYQATNWIYTGITKSAEEYLYKGKQWHGRAFRKKYGSHKKYLLYGLRIVNGSTKHRYLMPLDKKLKCHLSTLSIRYPKKMERFSRIRTSVSMMVT